MSFDLAQLVHAIKQHRRVARVVVAETAGSTPREVGAAMLVWDTGQIGTIGGGELELRATKAARIQLVADAGSTRARLPLGPELAQCCGGAVTLLTDIFPDRDQPKLEQAQVFARPANGRSVSHSATPLPSMPLSVKRILDRARAQGQRPSPKLLQGWMIEPISHPSVPLWIYGAGHVGRALINVLSPIGDLAITWVDTGPDRFPAEVPASVTCLPAANPANAVRFAPDDAHHLVLTYSHSMDLDLCHTILSRPFVGAGLIGSATKWARFQKRLTALGHCTADIQKIQCPIGDPGLGKTPQAIALGVACALLKGVSINNKSNRGAARDRGYARKRSATDT